MTAIDYSVGRLIEGLVQLHEFKDACLKRARGLETLHGYSKLNLLLVTYEPFYTINSHLFKEVINKRLSEKLNPKGIQISDWYILSVSELEKLQPHMVASIKFSTIFQKLKTHVFNNVLNYCHDITGKTYRDSFLYEMDIEIYKRLNVPF